MLATNRPSIWGQPIEQWTCEHCGAENNTWRPIKSARPPYDARDLTLVHVYRDRVRPYQDDPAAPMLDLCQTCWAAARKGADNPQLSLFESTE